MRILKQTLRGCGHLPYVGSHPGNFIMVAFPIVGLLIGGLAGIAIATGFILPLYLCGAYGRAEDSDACSMMRPKGR